MAIKVTGTTVIDDSRNIQNIGIATITSALNVGTGGTVITTTVAGLVGIGTTVPAYTLHVQGNARITGSIVDSTGSTGSSPQLLQSTTVELSGLLIVLLLLVQNLIQRLIMFFMFNQQEH